MEILTKAIRQEKEIKRIQIGKEEVKLSLFSGDILLPYIENSKDATKKLLEQINDFIKFQDTKLKHRNLLRFFTLTTTYQEEKLRNQSHLQLHQKEIKYLGIYLTKEVKDLYSENYKTVMKRTETTPTDDKIYHAHRLEELILLK